MENKEPSLFDDFVMKKSMTVGVRFQSMFLDHILISILATPILLIVINNKSFGNALGFSYADINVYIFIALWAVYFCKDCIGGRSLAKRRLKLQVVDNRTGKTATPLQCFIRNIFMIIWPIEVIVTFFNPERRLGDRLAGTKIIYFDPKKEQEDINIFQVILSFILALILSFALMWVL